MWSPSDLARLRILESSDIPGRATVLHCQGAGHWMHAEKPQGLADLMMPHIIATGSPSPARLGISVM